MDVLTVLWGWLAPVPRLGSENIRPVGKHSNTRPHPSTRLELLTAPPRRRGRCAPAPWLTLLSSTLATYTAFMQWTSVSKTGLCRPLQNPGWAGYKLRIEEVDHTRCATSPAHFRVAGPPWSCLPAGKTVDMSGHHQLSPWTRAFSMT